MHNTKNQIVVHCTCISECHRAIIQFLVWHFMIPLCLCSCCAFWKLFVLTIPRQLLLLLQQMLYGSFLEWRSMVATTVIFIVFVCIFFIAKSFACLLLNRSLASSSSNLPLCLMLKIHPPPPIQPNSNCLKIWTMSCENQIFFFRCKKYHPPLIIPTHLQKCSSLFVANEAIQASKCNKV